MSISIGPTPVLDDLILWYDAASYKCYSGEPTTNQLSQDYYGESGVATGDASINLSGLFGLGLISQRPYSHEVWSLDNINKGKLTRYGAYYFDGINDYLEIPDDDAFSFTNGTDDLPFSVSAWVKSDDLTGMWVITKYANSGSSEFIFSINNSDKLSLSLFDNANSTSCNRASDAALTAYEEQWIHIAATCSSSSAGTARADDITLYVNGAVVASTATNSGTYSSINNTSAAVWIGRQGTSYAKGHIKNVKIFNRELNAGEVYQLYYSNSLNGVVYSSDFSSGTDGWVNGNGLSSVTGNIDSIDSRDNNLKLTINSSNEQHYAQKTISITSGKKYRISLDTYYPSTNSDVDGFRISGINSEQQYHSQTANQWNNHNYEFVAIGTTLNLSLASGASIIFQDTGGDDVLYIRNINVVELDNQSPVDFADEWGGDNLYTGDSSTFDSGLGNWTEEGGTAITVTQSGGEMIITNTSSTTGTRGSRNIVDALKEGKRYRVSFDIRVSSGTGQAVQLAIFNGSPVNKCKILNGDGSFSAGSSSFYQFFPTSSSVRHVLEFIIEGSGVDYLYFRLNNTGAGEVYNIDNVTVQQIGILADFDLANYDDNDKITDRSSNKFIASPQGGALARERWFAHDLSFSKDTDNNDIATITRNPASGAFYENSNSLTLFGEHPLYITNASTGDKVSVSLQVKSNQTGLFTGINFFNSGTSANESVLLNRVILPDNYEYIYGTSNLIATGDNVGFELLMNRDFSSGWNYINLKKPQIELKDHATNYTSLTRSGDNAIVNLANRNLYTGTIVNDIKSSGVAKIDGVQAYYPLSGGYWEFNGIDTNINTKIPSSVLSGKFTIDCVFKANDLSSQKVIWGIDTEPFFAHNSAPNIQFSAVLDGVSTASNGTTQLLTGQPYYSAVVFDGPNKTGEVYLNDQLEKGFSFNTYSFSANNLLIGDRDAVGELPFDGNVYMFRLYSGKALTSQQIVHNYQSVKTKYGL